MTNAKFLLFVFYITHIYNALNSPDNPILSVHKVQYRLWIIPLSLCTLYYCARNQGTDHPAIFVYYV